MILSDAVLTGPLSLGKDLTWNSESVLSDLCFYTEDSTEESPLFHMDLLLKAIVNSSAVKLFMYTRTRWKVACVESNSSIQRFLSTLFMEEINLSGVTKKALLIQANLKQDQAKELYPFEYSSTTFIMYGELIDSHTLYLYAQPFYNDLDFEPIYEPYTELENINNSQNPFLKDGEEETRLLDEIFGTKYKSRLLSPPPLPPLPLNRRLSELEMIKRINYATNDNSPRDLILEAKIAQAAKKQLVKQSRKTSAAVLAKPPPSPPQTTSGRVIKSKPSKYKAPSQISSSRHIPSSQPTTSTGEKTLLVQNKEMTRMLIKRVLETNGAYDIPRAQVVYNSIKHLYAKELNSHVPMNEERLLCLIKMHTNFYNSAEDVIQSWQTK